MPRTIEIRGDNLTADLLLWRVHGVRGQELIEELMTLNPGLADVGPILTPGSTVIVPDIPRKEAFATREIITLFG